MSKNRIWLSIIKLFIRKKRVSIEPDKINRVLILRLGAMGDVLRTTPLLRELRRALPNAKIDYLVGEYAKPVLEGNPNIDEIIGMGGKLYGISISTLIGFYKMSRIIRRRRYDLIINLEPHYLSQLFALSCGIPISIGWDRYGEGFSLNNKVEYDGSSNEIEKGLELMKFFGVKSKDTRLDLYLSKHDIESADRFVRRYKLKNRAVIGMAPGASKNEMAEEAQRRWPIENYREISKRLVRMGYYLIFFGGKYDRGLIRQAVRGLDKNSYTDTSGKTTIKEAAALIGRCNLFIAHDSGPMHIAAAMNVPIIAMFGPTSPRRAAPMTKDSYILYKKKENEPEKYDVWGRYINCDRETYMERIKVNDVLRLVNRVLTTHHNKNKFITNKSLYKNKRSKNGRLLR